MKSLFISLIFAILAPFSALAANIYISHSGLKYPYRDEKGCQIYIKGIIEGGDFEKVKSIYDQGITYDPSGGEAAATGPLICLDSPGGSLVEAIKIATLIKDSSNTIVLPNTRCESACSIIFMAGSINGQTSRSIYGSSKIGFHAPELKLEGSNYSAQNVSKAYDLAIMTTSEIVKLQILPAHVLEMLTSTPHSSMRYIDTVDDLLKAEITLIKKNDPTSNEFRIKGEYSEFQELPALSAERLIANLCEHSHRMQSNNFTKVVGYKGISVTESEIRGTALIELIGGDTEFDSSPCEASIRTDTSYCGSKVCFSRGETSSGLYARSLIGDGNNPSFGNVLTIWNGQANLRDMDRQAMSISGFSELITKHRPQATTCALDDGTAKISNVQNFTNLRRQAGLNGQVIGQVPLGATVSVVNPGNFLRYDRCAATCNGTNQNAIKQCIDNNDVWIEVQYNGRRGFLSRKFLE